MKKKTCMAAMAIAYMILVPCLSSQAMEEEQVRELAEEIGTEYAICPELLQILAFHESSYKEDAENDGCIGLMQIDPKWHEKRMEELGITDLHDPEQNMWCAADYLAELAGKYEDIGMALMVYTGNSGAWEYYRTGEGLSEYVEELLRESEQLEREHGK